MNTQNIPWKRISVEAAAIVASILLAFAIDAWWDERVERIEEREILESLQVEFLVNRDAAQAVVQRHETGVQNIARFVSLTDEQVLELSAEEIEDYLLDFASPYTFDPVRGTVDVLLSSGKLGILESPKLREALTTFTNIVEDSVEDQQYMSAWALAVWEESARVGGPYRKRLGNRSAEECADSPRSGACFVNEALDYLPAATPEDLLRLRQDKILMSYVNRGKEVSIRYASEVRRVQDQIEVVLELVEESLQ